MAKPTASPGGVAILFWGIQLSCTAREMDVLC